LLLLLLLFVFFEKDIVADKRQQYQNKKTFQIFGETPQKTSGTRRRRALASTPPRATGVDTGPVTTSVQWSDPTRLHSIKTSDVGFSGIFGKSDVRIQ